MQLRCLPASVLAVALTLASAPSWAQDDGLEDESSEGAEQKEGEKKEEEKPRPGIPVTEPLLHQQCVTCHTVSDDGMMSRISYMRKTPEGWEISLKRMVRMGHVPDLTPEQAKNIVRYLANHHGLARSEAESSLYEVERRVHWSEEEHDKDLLETCGKCHTLGRVLSERRDPKEWQYLKSTHLAFFPLAQFQAFRESNRERIDWESLSESEAEERWSRMNDPSQKNRADRILGQLAKDLPLFTPEWEAWQINRREVPVAGVWTVVGREPGRGEVRGRVRVVRVEEDGYETEWELAYDGKAPVVRKGQGLLYAGYSWRGRSTTFAPGEPETLREVLLLDDDWSTFRGRIFTGEYNELGFDVALYRETGSPRIFDVENGAAMIPSTGHRLELACTALPEDLAPSDFHIGAGVTVTGVERTSDSKVTLTVDVARDAERGTRMVYFRAHRGPSAVVLYDTIDYIKILPEEGFSRVGGKMRGKQLERFEAVAMNRGADDETYTDDDYQVQVVPAQWQIEEFPIRENDDDAQYVGTIDANTGVFVPGLDGPNPERRWSANNIGDVYVVATCTLNVQELPQKPEAGAEPPPADSERPIVMVDREFRARGHLLVTIPLYVRWDLYLWDQR